jgi:hypothetical protein
MDTSEDLDSHICDYQYAKYMLDNKKKIPEYFIKIVSKNGDFVTIKFLRDSGVDINPLFFEVAKAGGLMNAERFFII